MSELSIEEIIVLRKRLKKLIKKAEALPEALVFKMDTFTNCAFSQLKGEDITSNTLAKYLRIKAINSLAQRNYWEGLTPLESEVVGLFTTKVGYVISSDYWLKEAKKVSKKLKKYIAKNTPQPDPTEFPLG